MVPSLIGEENHDLRCSFINPYGGHSDHLLSFSKDDLGRWRDGSSGRCLSLGDRQCHHPAHSCLSYPSSHRADPWALSFGHQWFNALAGGSFGKGISRQWFLGSSIWLDLDQHRELDLIPILALLRG